VKNRKSIVLFSFLVVFASSPAIATDYYVDAYHDDASNTNSCMSIEDPCLTIGSGLDLLQPGDTLKIREGIYRLLEQNLSSSLHDSTTASLYFTLTNYDGERVQIYGSLSSENRVWEQYNSLVWRTSAEFLNSDPAGMFLGDRRVEHQSDLSGSPRKHDNVSELTNESSWTKADVNGDQCLEENTDCYIYYYPPENENPNQNIYELSQMSMGRISSDYTQLRGLEFYYTQPQPIFFEYADNILIENNIFAHNSNSDDNAYGLRIWESGGAVVRNNKVYDSVYWGGTSNSKGITFMITDPENPHVVEYNEVYDIPGRAAIGTKGGTSGVIARYNYIHDVYSAFEPGSFRCVWTSSNNDGCQVTDEEYRPGGGWEIYGNVVVNSNYGLQLHVFDEDNDNNILHNNTFVNVDRPVNLGYGGSTGNEIYNNIFMQGDTGIYLDNSGSGVDRGVEDFLDQYTSDNNLFFDQSEADIFSKTNWQGGDYYGVPYFLLEFQEGFDREQSSLSLNPMLDESYEPSPSSPVCKAGRNGQDIGANACKLRFIPAILLPLLLGT
jgi:Right handed beta helix region